MSNTDAKKPCVQKIVVQEETSSALIIMGIFFIVVVIGLFYYLPKWSPGDGEKCCNSLGLHDTHHSENKRDSLLARRNDGDREL